MSFPVLLPSRRRVLTQTRTIKPHPSTLTNWQVKLPLCPNYAVLMLYSRADPPSGSPHAVWSYSSAGRKRGSRRRPICAGSTDEWKDQRACDS
jgi:hypothetical protein